MALTLNQDLRDKIDTVKANQTKVEQTLKTSKDNVKEELVNSILKVMSDNDFDESKEYLQYLTANVTFDSPTQRKLWIKSLSKDEQIDLLAEYSIDAEREKGHNDWESDLMDMQKAKEATKKRTVAKAKEVIQSFRLLLKEHDLLIKELKEKVERTKNEIKEKDAEMSKIEAQITSNLDTLKTSKNAAPTQDQIDAVKKANDSLNDRKKELSAERTTLTTKLTNLEHDLDVAIQQKDVYKQEVENAISAFEENLKDMGVYAGSYEGLGESGKETQNSQGTNITNNVGNVQTNANQKSAKETAKDMMVDFENASPEELKEMIDQTGYNELRDMSKELRITSGRHSFRNTMQAMLDDLGSEFSVEIPDENNPGMNKTIKIPTKELENIFSMDDNNFNNIKEVMKYYTENYQKLSVAERKEADEKMYYLKLSALISETSQNRIEKFGRKIGKIFKKRDRDTRVKLMTNSLGKFAKEKGIREEKKWQRDQDIRTRLSVKSPIPSTTRKKHMDKSGVKRIQKEYGDE